MRKNVFLFPLHLKWIVRGNELNILQLQRRGEMHPFALQHEDGLVLFPFCFSAGLVRDSLWMVVSPLALGMEKNSSHQALFFLGLLLPNIRKINTLMSNSTEIILFPTGQREHPVRLDCDASILLSASLGPFFSKFYQWTVWHFPHSAGGRCQAWDLCRGEELHQTILSPCPWNNDKWSCSLLSSNLPS